MLPKETIVGLSAIGVPLSGPRRALPEDRELVGLCARVLSHPHQAWVTRFGGVVCVEMRWSLLGEPHEGVSVTGADDFTTEDWLAAAHRVARARQRRSPR